MSWILTTIHGSRLYGTNRPDSDHDTYRVVTTGRTRQTIIDDHDMMVVTLDDFLRQVAIGVPQALEALWSPLAVMAPEWAPFLRSMNPGRAAMRDRYDRTIANFMGWVPGGGRGRVKAADPKRRLHSLRMCRNLYEYGKFGHFDPRLPAGLVTYYRALAESQQRTEWYLVQFGHVRKHPEPVSENCIDIVSPT